MLPEKPLVSVNTAIRPLKAKLLIFSIRCKCG
jgi:hypothetical protein